MNDCQNACYTYVPKDKEGADMEGTLPALQDLDSQEEADSSDSEI